MCVMVFDSGVGFCAAPSLPLYLGEENTLCGCYGQLAMLNTSAKQYAFDQSGMQEIYQS